MGGQKPVGFLGLGTMGGPMATNVLKAGFPLVVWNRTKQKARPLLEMGALWADSPRAAAEKSDTVITMLADASAVRQVLFGPEGVVASGRKNLRIIDMSTISPMDSVEIAHQAAEAGMVMIDAPVSGSPRVAADGTLTVIVGGDASIVDEVRPLLASMGKNIFYIGPNGMGCYMKLVNNIVLAVTLAGFSEAFTLGKKAGLPPQKIVEVILAGSARCPLLEFKGKAIADRNFTPTFALRLMRKDLSLALETAGATKAPLPLTGIVNEFHQAAIARGLGDRDFSSIVQVFESLAAVET